MARYIILLLSTIVPLLSCQQHVDSQLSRYNIIWNSPSQNSRGSMPIGNGDIGSNVWVEPNGDLCLLLSKTDCWSENARLLKLGKLRISMNPNPIKTESYFKQELSLEEGTIKITAGNERNLVHINIWIDANQPVINIDCESKKEIELSAKLELWRTERRELKDNETFSAYGLDGDGAPPIFVEPDTILSSNFNTITWCHRNERSIWKNNLLLQKLDELTDVQNDFLLHRTFGCMMKGEGLISVSESEIHSEKPQKEISLLVYPLTAITLNTEEWLDSLNQQIQQIEILSTTKRKADHQKWWKQFWKRSYIYVSSNNPDEQEKLDSLTSGYILQRYINACSGRGSLPIKFNGTLFTVDTYGMDGEEGNLDADYRRWGAPYWWQNTRLPYWTMLSSGDFEMMKPMFDMYINALPLRKFATRKYYKHAGAYYPETLYPWGTYVDSNYGRDREGLTDGWVTNKYIRYYWQCGIELGLMMLDYYSMTEDTDILRQEILPYVAEIITFYDQHWERDEHGKILFDPAMSLETYGKAINPAPDIAGIYKVCTEILNLSESLTDNEIRNQCSRLIEELPEIPVRRLETGDSILSPADSYSNKQNFENPELYAVFPYRIYMQGKENLEMAKLTFENREFKGTGGWQQDAIQAAYLGLDETAAKMTQKNLITSNPAFRFPAMWGPNFDWTPDQDHGCVAMISLQRMLLQYDEDKIYLLQAWPKHWNVSFKLHAQKNTIVEGKILNGKIEYLNINPDNNELDIVIADVYK